jgi:hypothetical protein
MGPPKHKPQEYAWEPPSNMRKARSERQFTENIAPGAQQGTVPDQGVNFEYLLRRAWAAGLNTRGRSLHYLSGVAEVFFRAEGAEKNPATPLK